MDINIHPESLFHESPWITGDLSMWESLFPYAKLVSYRKNQIIYHQNNLPDCVYIVKEGRVNLSILSSEGVEKSLYVVTEGAAFGEVPHVAETRICGQATAKTESQIYEVPAERFNQQIYSDPQITRAFATLTAKKIHLLTGQIELLSFFDTNYRICKMLIYLTEQYGVEVEGGLQIDMRFTHQELANMVGASRVSVTKALNDLVKSGIICRVQGKFLIIDTEKLREHSTTNFRAGQGEDE